MLRRFWYFLFVLFFLPGCFINANLMLKTDKNFIYDTIPESPSTEYRISPNDIINFRLYANDGFMLIDVASGIDNANRMQMNRNYLNYLVETDGTVRLPIIGKIPISGYTVREAEFYLEEKYNEFYVKPFVQVQVVNKRVIVFPGNGSDAKVITLENNNTTLMEVIAMAGGITERGRAAKIKVIRKVDGVRKVYLVDLSTIDGLKYVDMIVQANDYIYVEPVPEVGKELVRDIAPIVSLLTSAILVYSVIMRL
jgi:polysaccharide biosynthesis/export protein